MSKIEPLPNIHWSAMANPEYLHKVECRCEVCGQDGEKFLTQEGFEDRVLPDEFVLFYGLVVCRSHVMEVRCRRPEGKDVGYETIFWADGRLTDIEWDFRSD